MQKSESRGKFSATLQPRRNRELKRGTQRRMMQIRYLPIKHQLFNTGVSPSQGVTKTKAARHCRLQREDGKAAS
jgi:hypothetical protein